MTYYGQIMQDKFVLEVQKYKRGGCFLEIGSGKPVHGSNTYMLEKMYGWTGVMVDKQDFSTAYKLERNNSIHILQDAVELNYNSILKNNNFPHTIDYLQVDLEVNDNSTLNVLRLLNKQVMSDYKFATVTFEHDVYVSYNSMYDAAVPGIKSPLRANSFRYMITRHTSRKIFKRHGYYMVFGDVSDSRWGPFEDWYVHPDLVDMAYIKSLQEKNIDKYKLKDKIKAIDWKDIVY
jgi:hypothetical protein